MNIWIFAGEVFFSIESKRGKKVITDILLDTFYVALYFRYEWKGKIEEDSEVIMVRLNLQMWNLVLNTFDFQKQN